MRGLNSDKDPLGQDGPWPTWAKAEQQRIEAEARRRTLAEQDRLWNLFVIWAGVIITVYFGSHIVYALYRAITKH